MRIILKPFGTAVLMAAIAALVVLWCRAAHLPAKQVAGAGIGARKSPGAGGNRSPLQTLAAPQPVTGGRGRTLFTEPLPQRIGVGQAKQWVFRKPIDVPKGRTLLSFDARMDSPPIGSTPYLEIRLNQDFVRGTGRDSVCRLLNKPMGIVYSVVKDGKTVTTTDMEWYSSAPNDRFAWRVVYSPDFVSDGFGYGAQWHRYVLDISDLVRTGENRLQMARVGTQASAAPLILEQVRIAVVPEDATSS